MNPKLVQRRHQSDVDVRQTASDRPGVAQPVPIRPVPEQPWGRILAGTVVLLAVMLGAWEWYWREFGATPGIRNSDGLWAIQRRRIDNGEGDATVFVGASRVYFDMQLDVWERLDGRRPIQLAIEGTSPLKVMEDLAADPKFTGRLLVDVAPEQFFGGNSYRAAAFKYFHTESPSQRLGQWLSMRLIEPFVAFYDPDFSLAAVLKRQPWPDRPGRPNRIDVRKLAVSEGDRNTHLWEKVENDPEYRALARRIWAQKFVPSVDDLPPEKIRKTADEQIDKVSAVVTRLREKGVKVLFVRPPSTGPFLDFEKRVYPRATTWDVLLTRSGAPGIHFEDYPELQQFDLPEWSHLSHADAKRFTAALHEIITRDFWRPDERTSDAR